MDAKLTAKQAVETCRKYAKLALSTTNRDFYNSIADLIESMAVDAAIGQAAIKAKQDKVFYDTCSDMHYMYNREFCNRCECIDFCRILDEKDGGAGE